MQDPLTLQPTVLSIAGLFEAKTPPNVDHDDLIQAGWEGALRATKRYDETAKTTLKTFASILIKGAILDFLRNSGLFRTQKRGDNLQKIEVLRLEDFVLFDVALDGYDWPKTKHIDVLVEERTPEYWLMQKEEHRPLCNIILALPGRTKEILWLYYWQEYPMSEIAKVFNLTTPRIWQILKKAEKTIKKRLNGRYKE